MQIFRNLLFLGLFHCLIAIQPASAQPVYDQQAMDELIDLNEKMKTDRLIVSIRDTIVTDHIFRGKGTDRYLLYSITKVFSGIAIGILIDQQKIEHPEVRVSTFFEEWKKDSLKNRISIRHLLQHLSGIEANKGSRDIYSQPDFVQYALNSPVISPPGEVHFYNNKAFNIISGIVHRVTGQSMEEFLREQLFRPLGITDYEWKKDNAGNTWGMDGLWMNAMDLMKVGQMLCNYGEWQGKRILSTRYCELMFQLPLTNAMNGLYGYAMAIRSLPIQEEISISPETIFLMEQKGLPATYCMQLRKLLDKPAYKYMELGTRLKSLFSLAEMEEIIGFASRNIIPLYQVTNKNFFLKHGGEYGLLLTAFPKSRKVIVRFLGEKWGRKMKADGSDYQYLIDDEIVTYMLKL